MHYVRTSPGNAYQSAVFAANTNPGQYFKSTLSFNATGAPGWNLVRRDGMTYFFAQNAPVQYIQDLSLPKTRFVRTDDVIRPGLHVRLYLRSARSGAGGR